MARIKGAMATRKRRKKVLKAAKGYYGGKHRLFKTAKQAVMKSGHYYAVGTGPTPICLTKPLALFIKLSLILHYIAKKCNTQRQKILTF